MSYMGMGDITRDDFSIIDCMFDVFIPQHSEIWLFGTGAYSEAFDSYLQECGVAVVGFVTSKPDYKSFRKRPVVSIEQFKNHYSCEIGLLLTISNRFYNEILPLLSFMQKEDILEIKELHKQSAFDRCGNRQTVPLLAFHIADSCSLSCYGCTAASPIIKDGGLYDIDNFKTDISRYKEIYTEVDEINFTGGDVFYNPCFPDFLCEARRLYPNSKVSFSTNGIELVCKDDSFWDILRENKIFVYWTLYPIRYKGYEKTVQKAKELDINLVVMGDTLGEDKNSWRVPFSEDPISKQYDFLLCRYHRRCAVTIDGILYPCCAMRQIKHLNEAFYTQIALRDGDSIDIHKSSAVEIQEFLKKRPPLCDYCAIRERRNMNKWLPSRGKKEEWILD